MMQQNRTHHKPVARCATCIPHKPKKPFTCQGPHDTNRSPPAPRHQAKADIQEDSELCDQHLVVSGFRLGLGSSFPARLKLALGLSSHGFIRPRPVPPSKRGGVSENERAMTRSLYSEIHTTRSPLVGWNRHKFSEGAQRTARILAFMLPNLGHERADGVLVR